MLFIETDLKQDQFTAKDLEKVTSLQLFMKLTAMKHTMFQMKKCSDSACYYCGQHPVRLPRDIFTGLQFVPLPLLNSSKDHDKKFSDLYGEIPSEEQAISHPRPFRKGKASGQRWEVITRAWKNERLHNM